MSRGAVPQEIFEQVLQTNIVDVVSDYIQLTKAGKNFKGLCPFHGENTPSFVVSPEKGIYKCFGCGQGGNVISFISQIEGISYAKAIVNLAERAGLKMDKQLKLDEGKSERPYGQEYEILEFAQGFYHYYLLHTKEGKVALEYLAKRKITIDLIQQFKIGLAPMHADALVKTLVQNNYQLQVGVKAGLLNEQGGRYYGRFKSRIMFPITNELGNVVGFSGRAFLEGDHQLAKYINSPETPIFQKSKLIYHLHEAKRAIRRHNRILLFEGFSDVMAATAAGFLESVATMGTALTEAHGRMLRRLTDQIIICFDGDGAGQTAAMKAIQILQNQNFKVDVLLLPANMDPDEFIKTHGAKAFESLIEQKIPAIDYQYRHFKKQFNLEFNGHKEQFKKQIFELAATITSSTLRELLLKALAKDISMNESSILQDFKSKKSRVYKNTNINNNKNEKLSNQTKTSRFSKYELAEKMLIYYMLQDRNVALKVEKELKGHLNDPVRQNIVWYILDYYETNATMNLQYFLNWIDEDLVKPTSDIVFEGDEFPRVSTDQVIEDLIATVNEYETKIRIANLKKQLNGSVSKDETLQLLGKINQIRRQSD